MQSPQRHSQKHQTRSKRLNRLAWGGTGFLRHTPLAATRARGKHRAGIAPARKRALCRSRSATSRARLRRPTPRASRRSFRHPSSAHALARPRTCGPPPACAAHARTKDPQPYHTSVVWCRQRQQVPLACGTVGHIARVPQCRSTLCHRHMLPYPPPRRTAASLSV